MGMTKKVSAWIFVGKPSTFQGWYFGVIVIHFGPKCSLINGRLSHSFK
jgi:hypothetical protein